MSFAVLFKIYFVDPFVVRQLERLKARVGDGHLYVIADETNGSVGDIPHDRVIRTTEADMIARGFAKSEPESALFWHAADYSLYRLFEDHPGYDYYITVEHDAVINSDLAPLVSAVSTNGADFVGKRIVTKVTDWFWWFSCRELYGEASVHPYLNAIAFHTGRSIPFLRQKRLEQSRRFRDKEINHLPVSEAFVPTELIQGGFKVANISDFGTVALYDYWPPLDEAELPIAIKSTFIHPVLEGERYVTSLLRNSRPDTLFGEYAVIRQKLIALDPSNYVARLFKRLDEQNQRKAWDIPLKKLQDALFELPEPSPNIALGKPATQSSISPMSRNQDIQLDAAGAVNGLTTGTFGFHTDADDPPWWMVDLEQAYRLDEIWVFNCLDLDSTNRHINIFVSENRRIWNQVLVRAPLDFGGVFGSPLMLKFADRTIARFIRVELSEKDSLRLDQVKVFGQPVAETAQPIS